VRAKQAIPILAPALFFGGLIHGQYRDVPLDVPVEALADATLANLPNAIQKEETQKNELAPCLQPSPLVSFDDYNGPLQKVVGTFGRKLERKSAHVPHYKPGAVLCSLELKDKFKLFVGDTLDPISFLSAGFNAGLDQASNNDPTFGQGLGGYGKRFAADFASDTTGRFLMDFAYPSIFGEDPRYYRLAHGTIGARLAHALEHTVIAHRDNGKHMFNFSEWFGLTTAVVVNNAYHPGNARGVGPTAEQVGIAVGTAMAFDVLREFWPEVAHKLRMPFRDAELQK